MPVISNRRERIYEGVKQHSGELFALRANQRFSNLYTAKHGTCLEYIMSHNSEFDTHIRYTRRELDVYDRYMRMRVHEQDKSNKHFSTMYRLSGE